MRNIFTKHPHTVKETYGQHFECAIKAGSAMIVSGIACIIHAFFPFLFEHTASSTVSRLHKEFIIRQSRKN